MSWSCCRPEMKCGCSNVVFPAALKNSGAFVGWLYFSFLHRPELSVSLPSTRSPRVTAAGYNRRLTEHSTRAFCSPTPVGHSVQLLPLHRLKASLQLTAQAQARSLHNRRSASAALGKRAGGGWRAARSSTVRHLAAHAVPCQEPHAPRTTLRTTERLVRAGPPSGHSRCEGGGGAHSSSAPFFILPRMAASFFSRSSGVTIFERIHLVIQFSWSWYGRMSAKGSCGSKRSRVR